MVKDLSPIALVEPLRHVRQTLDKYRSFLFSSLLRGCFSFPGVTDNEDVAALRTLSEVDLYCYPVGTTEGTV